MGELPFLCGNTKSPAHYGYHTVNHAVTIIHTDRTEQARSQDQIWEGAGPPKSGPFEPHLPQPSYKKPHFWPTLWIKVDLLADLGWCVSPPPPPPHPPPLATGLAPND